MIDNSWDAGNIGLNSFASGENTKASGSTSTAMGSSTVANGNSSTAMGSSTVANGNSSTAMGGNTLATGNNSTALGYNTIAVGENSTSMGSNTTALSYGSVVMGQFNSEFGGNETSWVSTDPLLILGNGTSDADRSTALVVAKNGNTGISGFTYLGLDASTPGIKMKKITGVGPAVNGNLNVAHGLNASKILSVQIFMIPGGGGGLILPPNYTISNGFEYQYLINTLNIAISNKSGNSANIGGKTFRMLITYEE